MRGEFYMMNMKSEISKKILDLTENKKYDDAYVLYYEKQEGNSTYR